MPASDLWIMPGTMPFSTTGKPIACRRLGRLVGRRDVLLLRPGDAIAREDLRGLVLGRRRSTRLRAASSADSFSLGFVSDGRMPLKPSTPSCAYRAIAARPSRVPRR